jgi:hypothetical protein
LREHSDDHRRHDGRVDSDRHVTRVLADDGRVELLETGPGPFPLSGKEPPGKVEWDGQNETDTKRGGDEDVELARAEHLRAESSPGDGGRVVRLGVLTRPDPVTSNVQQDLPLLGQDGDGHDVVEDGADDGTQHLSQEGVPGGNLQVDAQLQVLQQVDGLDLRVVSVHGGVHVGHGLTGKHVGGEQLVKTGSSRDELTESEDTGEEGVDGGKDEGDQEDDDQSPPRGTRFTGIVGSLGHGESTDQDETEPPSGNGLVLEHLEVVLVGDVAVVFLAGSPQEVSPTVGETGLDTAKGNALEEDRDVLVVPKGDVDEGSTDTQVVDHQEQGVGSAESGGSDDVVLGLVEFTVGQERGLVVLVSLSVKDGLRHEGEVETVPGVSVVDTGHSDVGDQDTNVPAGGEEKHQTYVPVSVSGRPEDSLVQLHLQGQIQAVGTDVVPVETPAEQTHTLVVGTTSEDVSEDGAGVVDQADDRDGRHQGEDPLGEDCGEDKSVRPY